MTAVARLLRLGQLAHLPLPVQLLMLARLARLARLLARTVPAFALVPALAAPAAGADYTLKRVANMADGAPAFVVLGLDGKALKRIECLQNGWVRADELAAQLLSSTAVMAAIIARRGQVAIEDLGPAMHSCVPVDPGSGRAAHDGVPPRG